MSGVDVKTNSAASGTGADTVPTIGIDLGTTYSVVGVFRSRKPEIVSDFETGKRIIPSCVAFNEMGCTVGQTAKELASTNTLYDAKRLIGRPYEEVDADRDFINWSFTVRNDGGTPKYEIERDGMPVLVAPEVVSSKVLATMKSIAENNCLEEKVSKAVITVPAYFSESQREATKTAGRMAGLEVIGLLNEPAAAALAYGYGKHKEGTVVIFDLGGGTLDLAVIRMTKGDDFRLLAYGGDTHLGGQDFDNVLLNFILKDIKDTMKTNLRDDPEALHMLRQAIELAKRKLSTKPQTDVNAYIARAKKGYRKTITRGLFEELCLPLFKKAVDLLPVVLKEAKVRKDEVDDVVLVGGSTRILKVQAMVRDFFGKEPVKSMNPDEAVALGAAIWAAKLTGEQGAKDVRLRDVASLSLGVADPSGVMAVIIPRGAALPAAVTKTFTTTRDNQEEAEFKVCQGLRANWADNHLLGFLTLTIPARRKGTVDIDASFQLDLDGVLKVTAKERQSGETARAEFQSEGRQSTQEHRNRCSSATSTSTAIVPALGSGPVIGIDLGTTYSVAAVYQKGKVEIFINDSGSRTTPSVVGFLNGDSYVGEAAKDLPACCQVFDAKRLIGRSYNDTLALGAGTHWPFMVIEKKGNPAIRVVVKENVKEDFSPEEISAMVLKNLKETAEASLQKNISRAVVTVPAFFNERQREMTKQAGKLAGLDVIAMINEPTAAAIAYGLDKKKGPNDAKKTIFIYDLGGGTFDVSVMTVEGNDFTVLASGGDTQLGGQDFDARLMNALLQEISTNHGVMLDSASLQDLRRLCELTKRRLSSHPEVPASQFFARHALNFQTKVTRARFEDLCSDLFKKTLTIAADVLASAKVSVKDIHEVVLVGGSTRIPKVRIMLRDFFDGKEPRTSINPDEAVAYGAAVHAAMLGGGGGELSNLVKLKDVTPLSLGIRCEGGIFSPVVPRNTPIPCTMRKTFTKPFEAATSVVFRVFQGERPLTKDNHDLRKEFVLPVSPLPPKDVHLDCEFVIDGDGLLTVRATERGRGTSGHVTVNPKEGALSEQDVKDMIERAERLKHLDALDLQRAQEAVRLLNRAPQPAQPEQGGRKRKRIQKTY
ncbi:Heat shock cognate 71 kDa protein [Frankliniella fusca]|uniref:Heat shock cognate 71 kDa protein n=1 Tax=Frankliniella fusca TaxID=407009 RepID=A0AAE1GZW8_9NEOP|nr:Heat shock cognate 71 kDa protein [Frankliniella fusca]